MCLLSHGLVVLLPVAVSAEPTNPTHETSNLQLTKSDSLIYFNALSRRHNYFYWYEKMFPPQNSH